MGKLKELLTNWRVIVLLVVMALFVIAIQPAPWTDGVVIKSVVRDGAAWDAGIPSPLPKDAPLARERVLAIDETEIHSPEDFARAVSSLGPNETMVVQTTRTSYRVMTRPLVRITVLNETELRVVEAVVAVNRTVGNVTVVENETVNRTVRVQKELREVIGVEDIGLRVGPAPTTNLRKGLDLQGGTRVVLKPAETVDDATFSLVMDSLGERLNVYGLSDTTIRDVRDPSVLGGGNHFIVVEIAGATEEEVRGLIGRQGKFEAKIGNETVFRGGQDITYVCRTAECSGLDPNVGCSQREGGVGCTFRFEIALSPEAADRQAELTRPLTVLTDEGGSRYLSEKLTLMLDDQEVDQLSIDESLRGRASTQISITGSGSGASYQDAVADTLQNMKKLQTVLISGSLPVKLDIVKIDNISPVLGSSFIKNSLLVAVLALAAVAVVLTAYYRRLKISIPIMVTALAEMLSILGAYAMFGWTLDLAAIAGVIVAVGTGVNDQIIITDEALRKEGAYATSLKERIKRAFSVIFSAFATLVVAMLPLLFAGAGLLRGFAITTIVGMTIGVLVTRPAYAAVVNKLIEE